MNELYVAAGGGGDVLAATIINAALRRPRNRTVIATYAWDRLLVDPLPGPRGLNDFDGLRRLSDHIFRITSSTKPVPPAGSTLPRLAAEVTPLLMLLDPYGGARGLARQLADAVSYFGVDRVHLVDVGGDILARGNEPSLRSPLADALALAACADLPAEVDVLVTGLGLDAELDEDYAHDRLGANPHVHTRLLAEHVKPLATTFDWHPSEATAMLAAACMGARGKAEVRDAGTTVTLGDGTATVYRVPLAHVLGGSPLARLLCDTTTFDQVEEAVRTICGFCEMDYERAKAKRLGDEPPRPLSWAEFEHRLGVFEDGARERGADFVTFRRVAEAIGRPEGGYEAMRRNMIERWPERFAWPIWSLTPFHSRDDSV